MRDIDKAFRDLTDGKFVLVFDSSEREGETDFVISANRVTKTAVRTMRKDGGGLICVTVHEDTYSKLDLPYLTDIYSYSQDRFPIMANLKPDDIPYDTKSAFSITINHRKTFTGITDIDRALTISEFARLCENVKKMKVGEAMEQLGRSFRSPGHVFLLNASKGLLDNRQGHTELATALLVMAGLEPSAAICEMMGNDGKALYHLEALKYGKNNGLILLDGSQIIDEWERRKKHG